MKLFEQFEKNRKDHPDRVIWADEQGAYTGETIDRLSGQVYAYLLARGLTREKIVMIHLPHGIAIPICEYGIWKAGACCVIAADWVSEEQFTFFREDSGCDFIIDPMAWNEILSTPYKPGWEEPEPHDAAYIVYTSSSTGKPKGVMHEYGDFDYIYQYLAVTEMLDAASERYGYTEPFYDVISFYNCINIIYIYNFGLILPIDGRTLSPEAQSLCRRYEVNNTSFMPRAANIRKAEETGILQYVYTGYEPVMGLFSETLPIINIYGMSESSTPFAYFEIDRYYDIAPVGKPLPFRPLFILGEDDTVLPAGEIGEIAFHNPYVRKYINLPELTRQAFRGGLFHTGDMGKFLPDGNLLVLGRKAECLYTESGLIVPLLIEIEMKKLFPGHWFHVSAYRTSAADRICVFHTPDFTCGIDEVREKLSGMIAAYQLPDDLLEIAFVPRGFCGKLNYAKLAEIFYAEKGLHPAET